jgi:hypothetical protein
VPIQKGLFIDGRDEPSAVSQGWEEQVVGSRGEKLVRSRGYSPLVSDHIRQEAGIFHDHLCNTCKLKVIEVPGRCFEGFQDLERLDEPVANLPMRPFGKPVRIQDPSVWRLLLTYRFKHPEQEFP